MLRFILDFATAVRVILMCRADLALESLALRQQVAVLQRRRPRPKLSRMDRLFWTALRSVWQRAESARAKCAARRGARLDHEHGWCTRLFTDRVERPLEN